MVWDPGDLGDRRRGQPGASARLVDRPETAAGIQLAIDGIAFTALFAVSRGAANPFTTLYFVPIMLATQVSPRWMWIVAAVCLAGFGSLFAIGPAGPHGAHFAAHLRGMWLAFAVSGVVITFFVHRIAIAIARQQAELYALREGALRDRQLAQIGSLAAGAAHELGTPLATLNVLVGELESMDADERAEAVESMRDQLGRCKRIIGSMANAELRADAMAAIEIEPWPRRPRRGAARARGRGRDRGRRTAAGHDDPAQRAGRDPRRADQQRPRGVRRASGGDRPRGRR